MASSYNHQKSSTTGSNAYDVDVAKAFGTSDAKQTKLIQQGETERTRSQESGKTRRDVVKQRGNVGIAKFVAIPSAAALATGALATGALLWHGADVQAATDAAQAGADTARAQAEASRINVETGDRNMCNIVVISTDKDGNKTVLNLGEGNPNDPHLTGDAIAELIKDGKATGGNVKVGNTNEATAVITLDATGKIVSTVIPESCKQEAGEVFDSPKA